jgi:hypothetical protein
MSRTVEKGRGGIPTSNTGMLMQIVKSLALTHSELATVSRQITECSHVCIMKGSVFEVVRYANGFSLSSKLDGDGAMH